MNKRTGGKAASKKSTRGTSAPAREPTLRVSAEKWNAWLAEHHAAATGALLMIYLCRPNLQRTRPFRAKR